MDDHESLFEHLIDASHLPMLLLGEDGRVLAASDERGGAGVPGSGHDVSLRSLAPVYLAALGGSEPWRTPHSAEVERTLPGGRVVHERVHLRRTAWGACLSVVDETELQSLRSQDVQTARLAALGFMVSGVCHEVTNPLTSLHSIVQILRAEKPLSPQLLERGLDNITINVKRILEISRRLVKFSRVGDEPQLRFAIDDPIADALHELRQQGVLRGIEVRHVRNAAATVHGIPGQMHQVFMNLFLNAAQAIAGAGRLQVTTALSGDMIDVLVADSGPGVPEQLTARIFEPFFTTRSDSQGTGLGLCVSDEIVREHGGTLELRHNSPAGATFCVRLPRRG